MIGAVLLVVEVDQQDGPLNAKCVGLGRVGRAVPGEIEFVLAARELFMECGSNGLGEVFIVG